MLETIREKMLSRLAAWRTSSAKALAAKIAALPESPPDFVAGFERLPLLYSPDGCCTTYDFSGDLCSLEYAARLLSDGHPDDRVAYQIRLA